MSYFYIYLVIVRCFGV